MKNRSNQHPDLFSPQTSRNIKACFECGKIGSIQEHHVVPRSLGGTKTVPLCESCHGKVHGRGMIGHRRLVRKGLEKAVKRGKTLGRPVGTTLAASDLLAKHIDIVKLVKAGHSVRHCAKITGKSKGTVENVRKILARERA